jgi:uncharacterized lipoprotein YajG
MKKILILLTACILLSSCKVKQKTVTKSAETVDVEQTVTKTTKEESVKKVESTSKKKEQSVTVKENEFVEVTGDSTGVLTITEVIIPQGKKITVTGAKTVTIGNTTSNKLTTKDAEVAVTKQEDTNKDTTEQADTSIRTDKSSRDTKSTIFSMNTFVAGGIGLGIFLILVIWYIKRQKIV